VLVRVNSPLEPVATAKGFRNLLPYLKDLDAWQREVRRLERNVVKLRKHRYHKLAKTLEDSLHVLKLSLSEERKEHAFTVNRLLAKIDRENRIKNKASLSSP